MTPRALIVLAAFALASCGDASAPRPAVGRRGRCAATAAEPG